MPFLKKTILTAAFGGEGVGLAIVERGPRGVRVVGEELVANHPDAAWTERLASAAAALPSGREADELYVVAPAAWCATRELALTPADWASAKTGVLESLEDILPIPAEDAHVGLLGLYDKNDRCDRGVVIAARRSVVDPVLAALQRTMPSARLTVLSSSMASLGLGLEEHGSVWAAEPDEIGETGVELRRGLPVSLECQRSDDTFRVTVGQRDSLCRLAVAAVLASDAAPDAYVPLLGEKPRAWKKYVPPAVAVAVAAMLIAATPFIWAKRLDAGTASAVAQRASLREDYDASQAARAEAERYIELCDSYDQATADWESVTPVLRDAVDSIEDNGFFYRLRYEGGTLFFTGESSDPGRVLERLEASSSLSGASQTTPLTPSPIDPEMLVFTFRAAGEQR